jgi:Ser/Thr protein kinase RdoA (MazF antagonist)
MSGGNSTYWDGRVIHFDFDCAGPGWCAYDLGVFFWSLSINGHGDDVWEPFLRGYSSRRALPGADLAMVGVFAAMRVIWLMGLWCASAPVLGYHKLHDDYFDRELALLRDFADKMTR